MSEYTVTGELDTFDFSATGVLAILQNIRMILATVSFSCPLARDFAWSPSIDAPINVAKAQIAHRVITAIREWEPRAEVLDISFQGDALNGVLKPIVKVRISDESTV